MHAQPLCNPSQYVRCHPLCKRTPICPPPSTPSTLPPFNLNRTSLPLAMSLTCCISRCDSGRGTQLLEEERPETEWLMSRGMGGGEEEAAPAARCAQPHKPLERAGSFDMPPKKTRKTHRRAFTTIGGTAEQGEPRLVRSGGMRRDWSFEDLRNRES